MPTHQNIKDAASFVEEIETLKEHKEAIESAVGSISLVLGIKNSQAREFKCIFDVDLDGETAFRGDLKKWIDGRIARLEAKFKQVLG